MQSLWFVSVSFLYIYFLSRSVRSLTEQVSSMTAELSELRVDYRRVKAQLETTMSQLDEVRTIAMTKTSQLDSELSHTKSHLIDSENKV